MNIINKYGGRPLWFAALMLAVFVTGCSSDKGTIITPPVIVPAALTVISTNPADAATGVAINQKVTATFSEPMDPVTLDGMSFTVQGEGEAAIIGDVILHDASNTAIFTPNSVLGASTNYTATITTAAKSITEKTMAEDYVWVFTTGTEADTTPPVVNEVYPANAETAFPLDHNITASFDKSLDPTTVSTDSFTVMDVMDADSNPVTGLVHYNDNGMVATFNPDVNLTAGIIYTATLTTAIKDLAGNALAANYTWTFSGTEVSPTRTPVDLGTAGDFAILAKTGISKTGAAGTMVTGDIGVSPAARTAITGFSETMDSSNTYATSDFVTGSIYAASMTMPTPTKMTTAVSDMETAFTDAAGRTLPDFTELYAGNITGRTLKPGLYKWGTDVLINAAGVTISGSDTDVWIFQIARDLIVDNAAIVTLAGGALPENIFWQVAGGTGVSIGTTAQFKGVVLAQKAITVNSGASINGRLLAQSAVTLDGNAITQP